MTYLLAGTVFVAAIVLAACTLVHVGVSAEDGDATVQPNGINVTVNKEQIVTGKGQQP